MFGRLGLGGWEFRAWGFKAEGLRIHGFRVGLWAECFVLWSFGS